MKGGLILFAVTITFGLFVGLLLSPVVGIVCGISFFFGVVYDSRRSL